MLSLYYRNVRDQSIMSLKEFRLGSWVHVEKPTEKDIVYLQEKFGLDESLLQDATDQYEVPRMEIEDGSIYIFTRYPTGRDHHISTNPLLVIICKEAVVTVSKEKFDLKDFLMKKYLVHTTQKTKLLLQLFEIINVSYNNYLHTISRQIRSSAYELEKINNKDIIQFVSYERVLNDFHLALVRTNAVLNTLLTHKHMKLYEDDKDLIEDLFLNNNQLIQLSKENLTSIVNIRDAYTTIMTNNTNRVVRFFTSVTVILTIPTIVASIFGMNVRIPFEDADAFFWIIMAILGVVIALVAMFWKNDWL